MNRVLQRSGLPLALLNIFIRGWEVSIKLLLIKLAGDTKIGKVVHNDEDVSHTNCAELRSKLCLAQTNYILTSRSAKLQFEEHGT